MPTVLHLLPTTADDQARTVHHALVEKLGLDQTTREIGPGKECRHLPAAVSAARSVNAQIVYAWGTTALAAAVVAGARRVVYSPDRTVGPARLKWVRAIAAGRYVTAVWPTDGQARVATAAGLHPARSFVIRPGADFSQLVRRGDSVRSALGWTDDQFVLLAPGESTPQAGHEMAIWTAGILNVLSDRFRLLSWGRGLSAGRIPELCRRIRLSEMYRSAPDAPFAAVAAAADVVLVTATGSVPTLPLARCMAAGLPVVATPAGSMLELVRDGHSASVVPTRSPRALTRRILDLEADPPLRWRLAENARADAYEHLSLARMVRRYRTLLTQVAEDRPVDPDGE